MSIADLERLRAMDEREVLTLGGASFDRAEPPREQGPRRLDIAAEHNPPG